MKSFSLVLTFTAVVSAFSVLALPTVRADGAACGEKGQPSCPLQGWMEKNMQDPMDKGDLKAVAASLEKAATLVPDPKWNDGAKGWAKIAKDAAAAAKSGDTAAVKAACKSCHSAWRKQYKATYRTRPVSG